MLQIFVQMNLKLRMKNELITHMCAHRSINRAVRNLSSTNSYRLLGITEHPKDTASPFTDQKQFLLSFLTAFWSQTGQKKQSGRKWVEKVDKSCIWWTKDKTILLECSVMLNYQLEIVEEEFVTSIGHSDEFYVNILFDRCIFIDRWAHIWVKNHLR